MNLLSLNTNGLGDSNKISWIRKIRSDKKVSVLCLQESHLSDSSVFSFHPVWGNSNFNVEWVNAIGRSGGIATLWNPSIFHRSDVYKDQNFLLVSGYIIGSGFQLHILNVYAPQDSRAKRRLWDRIGQKLHSLAGRVILLGDFNVVRNQDERLNSIVNMGASTTFNEFINRFQLLEYQKCRKKFTYIPSNLQHMSKLDRMLVNHEFMGFWPNATLSALDRGQSDHCPILLQCSTVDFGPQPFRLFNSRLKKVQFPVIIHQAANIPLDESLPPDKRLACKLKNIKLAIKNWLASDGTSNEENFTQWENELFLIEQRAENGSFNDDDVTTHREVLKKLTSLRESRNLDMRQKARVKWSIDEDENSAYFHGYSKPTHQLTVLMAYQ